MAHTGCLMFSDGSSFNITWSFCHGQRGPLRSSFCYYLTVFPTTLHHSLWSSPVNLITFFKKCPLSHLLFPFPGTLCPWLSKFTRLTSWLQWSLCSDVISQERFPGPCYLKQHFVLYLLILCCCLYGCFRHLLLVFTYFFPPPRM